MTTKPTTDAPDDESSKESGYATRADLKADAKPTETGKTVKLTSPSGARVETAEENADKLREAGFS